MTPMLIISTHPGTIIVFVIIVLLVVFWNKLKSSENGATIIDAMKGVFAILFFIGYMILVARCS